MKHIAVLCAALLATGVASAQYINMEPGTTLVYTESMATDKDPFTADFTSTVASAETGADGVITVTLNEVHKVPGNELGEIKANEYYTYNPADGLTVHYVLRADDYRDQMVEFMVETLKSQGQYPSESDIAELRKMIKVKGDLKMPLPAETPSEPKIANSSMKLTAGPTSVSMNLWEGKYLGKEGIETPAGKFDDCEKVSYTLKTTSPQGNERTLNTVWYAKGIGIVKQVATDKKGKEISSVVLKEIKK